MITSDYRPVLKQQIEIFQAEHEGKQMILLKDAEGLTEKTLLMPAETVVLLELFNGKNSVRDIQSTILRTTGELVSESEITDFIKQLEDSYFLEGEKTNELRRKIYEEFKKSNVRKAIHKGLSYPDNILELSVFMSRFLRIDEKIIPNSRSYGLIVPHIDILRGGRVYSNGYGRLLNSEIPDVVIAFGTSHRGGNSPLIMTKKSYETPYGNIETDIELYMKFKEVLWYEPDDEEILHKNEHSLEFQALWLKYIWREKTPKWLPILTSNYERFAVDIPPSSIENIERMFRDVEKIISELSRNKRVMVIAAADFSHIGPRFGDEINITQEIKAEIERKDKEKISHILNLDPDGFYISVISEKNSSKICGLSSIYAALRAIKSIEGDKKPTLLDYAQADDPFGGFVSFASIVF
ncbi:MAG: AmmeMemoRadiSam system protein B [Elusimicrobiales bacterium]